MLATVKPLCSNLPTPSTPYTRTAISLHWVIASLIFAAFPLGVYMHGLSLSPDKLRLFSYHKWMGITVLLVAVVRVAWRFTHRPPELPGNMAAWERFAAMLMHYLLYAIIFAIPLSGWIMSSATGLQTVWFGVLPLPDLVGRDKILGDYLLQVHQGLNIVLFALVVIHIAAALKHHLVEHDSVLLNMLPRLLRRGSASGPMTG